MSLLRVSVLYVPQNATIPSTARDQQEWDLVEIPRMELIVQTPGCRDSNQVRSEEYNRKIYDTVSAHFYFDRTSHRQAGRLGMGMRGLNLRFDGYEAGGKAGPRGCKIDFLIFWYTDPVPALGSHLNSTKMTSKPSYDTTSAPNTLIILMQR